MMGRGVGSQAHRATLLVPVQRWSSGVGGGVVWGGVPWPKHWGGPLCPRAAVLGCYVVEAFCRLCGAVVRTHGGTLLLLC